MSTLTDEMKTFIVMALARFDAPSEVVEAVRVNFGVEISRQQVHAYDPACSKPPAPRWQELFAATRDAFLRDVAAIGVAQRIVRLRMLDRMAHRAEARNNLALAASFLEQAAKECGGLYDRGKSSVLTLPPMPRGRPEASACLEWRPPAARAVPGMTVQDDSPAL